jgi:hypothetical protein
MLVLAMEFSKSRPRDGLGHGCKIDAAEGGALALQRKHNAPRERNRGGPTTHAPPLEVETCKRGIAWEVE